MQHKFVITGLGGVRELGTLFPNITNKIQVSTISLCKKECKQVWEKVSPRKTVELEMPKKDSNKLLTYNAVYFYIPNSF